MTRTVAIDTDLSAKQYHFVSFDATDDDVVNILAASTSVPFILTEGANGATTATVGSIALSGVTKLKIAGTVAAGDKLTATTGGAAITTVTNNQNYGAIALVGGVSGDIIEVSAERGMIGA